MLAAIHLKNFSCFFVPPGIAQASKKKQNRREPVQFAATCVFDTLWMNTEVHLFGKEESAKAYCLCYSPTWIDGKKHARNVYAHTCEECEEKLKVLIAEMKAELAELKRQKGDRH